MNSNLTHEEISTFNLYAIQIFEAERNHPLHTMESLPYSDTELRAIQRMAAYIESYVIENADQFKSFVTDKKDREYLSSQAKFYDALKKNYLEEKRFPEPYFFTTPYAGYEYIVIAQNDWIVPNDNHDIYGLFLVFKIRNLPVQSIQSFLDYQYGSFRGDFRQFLEVLLVEYQELLNSKQRLIIKKWLIEKFPEIYPPEKLLQNSLPEEQVSLSTEKIQSENEKNEKEAFMNEYTNAQKVLIIYYSLLQINPTLRAEADMTQVARFMHLLFDKEVKQINNSTFYRHLKNVPNVNEPKQLFKDLKKIRPRFEKAQMDHALKLIDKKIAEISKKVEL